MMIKKFTGMRCLLYLMGIILAVGCSPGIAPEEEPANSPAPEPVELNQPVQPEIIAYPSPEEAKEKSGGYPEPAVLAQPTSYPEPEVAVSAQTADPKKLKVKIINSYPHNQQVFTQGLIWGDGFFFESGGLYGESALYKVSLEGETLQQTPIASDLFSEGIALVDDRIFMLTWQKQTALVFDQETFEEIGRFSYTGQGWGLCYDESNGQLWMSDGSQRIVSRDPITFEVTGEIMVTLNGAPLAQINELECVDGTIYANLWKSDKIVGINSETGIVELEVDASELLTAEEQAILQPGRHVLNGIAYDKQTGRFYLTGKQWPRLFEVEFEQKE